MCINTTPPRHCAQRPPFPCRRRAVTSLTTWAPRPGPDEQPLPWTYRRKLGAGSGPPDHDHRHNPQFLVQVDRLGPGPAPFAPYVEQVGTLPTSSRPWATAASVGEAAAVGKTVGGDIDDAHDKGSPPRVEHPVAEAPFVAAVGHGELPGLFHHRHDLHGEVVDILLLCRRERLADFGDEIAERGDDDLSRRRDRQQACRPARRPACRPAPAGGAAARVVATGAWYRRSCSWARLSFPAARCRAVPRQPRRPATTAMRGGAGRARRPPRRVGQHLAGAEVAPGHFDNHVRLLFADLIELVDVQRALGERHDGPGQLGVRVLVRPDDAIRRLEIGSRAPPRGSGRIRCRGAGGVVLEDRHADGVDCAGVIQGGLAGLVAEEAVAPVGLARRDAQPAAVHASSAKRDIFFMLRLRFPFRRGERGGASAP